MALVLHGFEWQVSFVDNSGVPTSRTYFADPATVDDFATLSTAVAAALPLVNAVTDAVIQSYRMVGIWIEDTLVLPPSGVENENNAQLSAKIAGNPTDSAIVNIPAADPDVFVALSGPGANVVDTSDPAITAFAGMFAPGSDWVISDGEKWQTSTLKGKRVHFKSSNG